jgi:hypothetical protein
VPHPKFGDGVVTAIEVDMLTIKFANLGVKTTLDAASDSIAREISTINTRFAHPECA